MSEKPFLLFCLACLAMLAPHPVNSQAPALPFSQQSDEADLVHFGDIIDVKFAGGFEFDWRGHLTPDGNLEGFDGLSEPILAVCRAESEIASDIERLYAKILREPKVSVKIIDRSNRAVARINGAVKGTVRFQLRRPAHLRELIVAAGGFTDDASGDIQVFRPANLNCSKKEGVSAAGNGLQVINITIKDILTGKSGADAIILSGDTVTVTKAEPIYVIGAVNNPRSVYSHTGMTLTRAVDSAGGLSKAASAQSVTIFRRDASESRVITADLEKIKKGDLSDVDLKAFDIIDVAFAGRPSRQYPPALAAGSRGAGQMEPPLKIIE